MGLGAIAGVVGGGLLALVALVVVVVLVFAGIAGLKRKGVDVTDGISASEWATIKQVVVDQFNREKLEAAKKLMVNAATDGKPSA